MVYLPQFFLENINIIFVYLIIPFIRQNLKKILTADPELRACAIFGYKLDHFSKGGFFQKTR